MTLPAIVLGVEHPRGVAVVHSLGRRGIPVLVVERNPTARGLRSRHVKRAVLVDERPESTVSALESLGRETGGVLIPTNDRFLMIVSQHHARLARSFAVTVPPWDVLAPLIDKSRCYRLAREVGLCAPRFFAPRDARELDDVVRALDPAVPYLLSTRLPQDVPADVATGRLTTTAPRDPEELRAACRDIAARGGELPLIVEIIPGRSDRCVGVSMVVDRDHAPVVAFCVRRLQLQLYAQDTDFVHPYELGANVYCESVRDDEAVEAATRLVRHARFYGAITVEFRRDSRDGRLTLVKTDPRMVRATSLSHALGLDVPTALYRVFTGGRVEARAAYPEGIAWIWPSLYVATLWDNRHRMAIAPQVWGLLKRARRLRASAYVSVRDPLPALVDAYRAAGHWVLAGARALRRRLRASPARA